MLDVKPFCNLFVIACTHFASTVAGLLGDASYVCPGVNSDSGGITLSRSKLRKLRDRREAIRYAAGHSVQLTQILKASQNNLLHFDT